MSIYETQRFSTVFQDPFQPVLLLPAQSPVGGVEGNKAHRRPGLKGITGFTENLPVIIPPVEIEIMIAKGRIYRKFRLHGIAKSKQILSIAPLRNIAASYQEFIVFTVGSILNKLCF